MSSYILGLGGNCCDSCTPDDACKAKPVITSASAAPGTVGFAYSYTITATNTPTSYSVTGSLPSGLSLNTTTGVISGTPTASGVFTVIIGAINACGTGFLHLDIEISGCTATAPTLVCDSISASKTKCGYDEYPGHISSPPKKYLTRTLTGGGTNETYTNSDCSGMCTKCVVTQSGSCTYDRSSCSLTSYGTVAQTDYSPDCSTVSGSFSCNSCGITDWGSCAICNTAPSDTTTVYTSTTRRDFGTAGCDGAGHYVALDVTETLSSEYTTTLLISDTVAALPSYPGTWAGTCSSYRNLSTDELTYTIRRFKYKFQLPSLTSGQCYRIDWLEGSTAKSYIWDGVATETPVYGPVSEPASNGTVSISSVTSACTGC